VRFPDRLPTLAQVESEALAEALRRTGGRQAAAAKLLGISQSAVSRRLARQSSDRAAAVRTRR
jgi:two-component system, NtrC family, response regulator AtoC